MIVPMVDSTWSNEQASIDFIHVLLLKENNDAYNNQNNNWLLSIENNTNKNTQEVDDYCRTMMIKWFEAVVDALHMNIATVEIAASFLDRFMLSPKNSPINRIYFQTIALTCFYMAVKINEPAVIDVDLMSHYSNGSCQPKHIEQLESIILQTLDWKMYPPTATAYVYAFMDVISSDAIRSKNNQDKELIMKMALVQIEYYVSDSKLYFTTKPSVIAYCSLMNALENYYSTTSLDSNTCKSLLSHKGYQLADIIGIGNCNDPWIVAIQDQLYYNTLLKNSKNKTRHQLETTDIDSLEVDHQNRIENKHIDGTETSPRGIFEPHSSL